MNILVNNSEETHTQGIVMGMLITHIDSNERQFLVDCQSDLAQGSNVTGHAFKCATFCRCAAMACDTH